MQPKPFRPKQTLFVASILIGLTVWTYFFRDLPGPPNYHWQGETMGTSWSIKVADADLSKQAAEDLYQQVLAALEQVNKEMSTYRPDSEINRFNQASAGQPHVPSEGFSRVSEFALDLAAESGGAFDPTIGPLVALWGFGPALRLQDPPSKGEVQETLTSMGYQKLAILADGSIQKSVDGVQIDLNAVAKGYGVDRCSEILAAAGLTHSLVEIGGEVRVRGHSMGGDPWKLGIQLPVRDAEAAPELLGTTRLRETAMATSGDYRNYYAGPNGQFVTHILDPRTGFPAVHHLASVTVVAETCMRADGLATAAFVMGPEEGRALIERADEAEALFLLRDSQGRFTQRMTSGFVQKTKYAPVDSTDLVAP
jgi:thiamine biosynthesis lipoprotein